VLKTAENGVLAKWAKYHSGPDLEFNAHVVTLAWPSTAKSRQLASRAFLFEKPTHGADFWGQQRKWPFSTQSTPLKTFWK
jgi:hypothetical protein